MCHGLSTLGSTRDDLMSLIEPWITTRSERGDDLMDGKCLMDGRETDVLALTKSS